GYMLVYPERGLTLNDSAARAARAAGVRAATDITGFGLLGHLGNILAGSHLAADLWVENLPVLERARQMADEGLVPGGTQRNIAAADRMTTYDADVTAAERILVADAQTSGGLLLAVAPNRLEELLVGLRQERTLASAVIGRLVEGETGGIHVSERQPS
ncbi:MAG TPA: AIR synthase-related protein, partial [Gemmatimonadales bacterium]|nr:AIR synthase-related protein [Gemmatimonadales bacterium]